MSGDIKYAIIDNNMPGTIEFSIINLLNTDIRLPKIIARGLIGWWLSPRDVTPSYDPDQLRPNRLLNGELLNTAEK